MLLTPEGKLAGKTDKTMLLAMWAETLREEMHQDICSDRPYIISAGMGPSQSIKAPLNPQLNIGMTSKQVQLVTGTPAVISVPVKKWLMP